MPSQPIAKKVLKMNRKRAATMPGFLPPTLSFGRASAKIDFVLREGEGERYHDSEDDHGEGHACCAEEHAERY